MPKSQAKSPPDLETQPGQEKKKREGSSKTEKSLSRKEKPRKPLLARVQKVVRKSRRKLSEEHFEKELQRTIAFLGEIQAKIGEAPLPQKTRKKKADSKRRKRNELPTEAPRKEGSKKPEEG